MLKLSTLTSCGLIATLLFAGCAILGSESTTINANEGSPGQRVSTSLTESVTYYFEEYANRRGIPYREQKFTQDLNDGYFARGDVVVKLRECRSCDWVEVEAAVEAVKVGRYWQVVDNGLDFNATYAERMRQRSAATATAQIQEVSYAATERSVNATAIARSEAVSATQTALTLLRPPATATTVPGTIPEIDAPIRYQLICRERTDVAPADLRCNNDEFQIRMPAGYGGQVLGGFADNSERRTHASLEVKVIAGGWDQIACLTLGREMLPSVMLCLSEWDDQRLRVGLMFYGASDDRPLLIDFNDAGGSINKIGEWNQLELEYAAGQLIARINGYDIGGVSLASSGTMTAGYLAAPYFEETGDPVEVVFRKVRLHGTR